MIDYDIDDMNSCSSLVIDYNIDNMTFGLSPANDYNDDDVIFSSSLALRMVYDMMWYR